MTQTNDLHVAAFEPLVAPNALLAEMPLGGSGGATGRPDSPTCAGYAHRYRRSAPGRGQGRCSVHDPAAALDYARRPGGVGAQPVRRTVPGDAGVLREAPDHDGPERPDKRPRSGRHLRRTTWSRAPRVGCCWTSWPRACRWGVNSWSRPARSTSPTPSVGVLSGPGPPRVRCTGSWRPRCPCRSASRTPLTAVSRRRSTGSGSGATATSPSAWTAMAGRPWLTTTGNADCHVILRGGRTGPNYGPDHVAAALSKLDSSGVKHRLVIDASHGVNSGKDHERQAVVAAGDRRAAAGRRRRPASPASCWRVSSSPAGRTSAVASPSRTARA